MSDLFVSIRGRVLLNVEALNMTESVGNYVKHRRVPIMLNEGAGAYSIYFMPAISGESIAHGFQRTLAELSAASNLPVCGLCSKGIFLKSSNADILQAAFGQKVDEKTTNIEEFIVKNCVVEDVGGFLYAEKQNVKRTSNFYTGYMIPTRESLSNVVIEPQLQSRYALGTKFVQEKGQMLYYVELSSAVYTFSLDVDTANVGKLTFSVEDAGKEVVKQEERKRRIEKVLDALQHFLVENSFGAKKTRFLPITEWESTVIAASDKTWTVPSPFANSYVENAEKKKEKVSYNTKLYIFRGGSFEQFVVDSIGDIRKRLA